MSHPSAATAIVKRYGVALLCGIAAIIVATLLRPLFNGQTPLTPFTIAVILAAAYGGLGPGLVSTLLCATLIYALPGGRIFSLVFDRPQPLLFLFLGVVISYVIERFRSANARVEAANRELSKRTEALAKSNEELERFAYALSHDLQAPLRTISMFTERLAENLGRNADEDSARALRFISEGVANMQAMIRGLLEYATASKAAPAGTITDMNAVLNTVLQDMRSQIEESGAAITHDALPAVEADETQIRQILQNLIANAIKYRGEPQPRIHVGAKQTPGEWTFFVRDNGTGIDMRYADRIFGLFERLDKDHGGTGIGLAVCRAIVERRGGRIWVESEPRKGATFYFTVPRGAAMRAKA